MDRTTYKDKSAIQKLGQFVPLKQNVDKEGQKTAIKYGIHLLPTLMVINADGKVILKHEGALDAKELAQLLKDASKRASKKK